MIPARLKSSRLPGKPLIDIAGKTLIEWVYERASQATRLADLWVATDDERVYEAVKGFDGKVMMTSPEHKSGTDRVAEVAARVPGEAFINIQGDEPLISPLTIDQVCAPFERDGEIQMTTARVKITDPEQSQSPHVVKVVSTAEGRALYFSRAAIPYPRRPPGCFYKHIGIYGYRRELLERLPELGPSRLEEIERLEQLRFLENGVAIQVVEVAEDSIGVDTPEDVRRVIPLLENAARGEKQWRVK